MNPIFQTLTNGHFRAKLYAPKRNWPELSTDRLIIQLPSLNVMLLDNLQNNEAEPSFAILKQTNLTAIPRRNTSKYVRLPPVNTMEFETWKPDVISPTIIDCLTKRQMEQLFPEMRNKSNINVVSTMVVTTGIMTFFFDLKAHELRVLRECLNIHVYGRWDRMRVEQIPPVIRRTVEPITYTELSTDGVEFDQLDFYGLELY